MVTLDDTDGDLARTVGAPDDHDVTHRDDTSFCHPHSTLSETQEKIRTRNIQHRTLSRMDPYRYLCESLRMDREYRYTDTDSYLLTSYHIDRDLSYSFLSDALPQLYNHVRVSLGDARYLLLTVG